MFLIYSPPELKSFSHLHIKSTSFLKSLMQLPPSLHPSLHFSFLPVIFLSQDNGMRVNLYSEVTLNLQVAGWELILWFNSKRAHVRF